MIAGGLEQAGLEHWHMRRYIFVALAVFEHPYTTQRRGSLNTNAKITMHNKCPDKQLLMPQLSYYDAEMNRRILTSSTQISQNLLVQIKIGKRTY